MSDMVTVKAKKPHKNSFGEAYKKAVGDEYALPSAMAVTLRNQGLISINRDQGAPAVSEDETETADATGI